METEIIGLKVKGTAFQIAVWQELVKIPKGEVRTYKDIAMAFKKPKAVRAVANAVGKNPYPPTIPCHRVIRTDGKLGGYSAEGGVELKKQLLAQERENK
jgi:methylated-DNA-[protein]-cysteine S-methyltransferase